jgi:hypothetical protein
MIMITLISALVTLGLGMLMALFVFWGCYTDRIDARDRVDWCFGVAIAFLLLMLMVCLVGGAEKQYYHNLM